jgi:hypothetical protein
MSTWEQATGRTTTHRTAPMPNGIAVGVGFVGAIVATTLAVASGSTHDGWLALIPLGLVTAAVSTTTGWIGGIATAWICWSLDSGFVLGREAQLNFSSTAQLSLLVLIVVALLAGAAGRIIRSARNSQQSQSANRSPETRS